MIRFNDDVDYEPVGPYFVMSQHAPAATPSTAGPFESVAVALHVWAAVAPEPPEIGYINLIFDGTGLAIFGIKRDVLRPPHSYGGLWIATTPRLLLTSMPVDVETALGIFDTLADWKELNRRGEG